MQSTGYTRLFVTEIVISAVFSAAFASLFTWVLFGTAALETPAAKNWLTLDFIIQAFMTTLFAYGFPGLSARRGVRKGKLAPRPFRLGWVNGVPFVAQIVLAAIVMALTLGLLAAFAAHMLVVLPISNARAWAIKVVFGLSVSTTATCFALLAGLCARTPAVTT